MQKGTVGGILAIVASTLGMIGSLFFFALPAFIESMDEISSEYDPGALEIVAAVYVIIGVVGLIIGALGIVGGIFAVRRKVWGMALAGAIASSILFYPLGIVAVILVSMGYPEFRKTEPVMPAPVVPPIIAPGI
jgi:hypothetical protein